MATNSKKLMEQFLFNHIVLPSSARISYQFTDTNNDRYMIGSSLIVQAVMCRPHTTNRDESGNRMRNFQRDRNRMRNHELRLVYTTVIRYNGATRTRPLLLINDRDRLILINRSKMYELAPPGDYLKVNIFTNTLYDLLHSNFPGYKVLDAEREDQVHMDSILDNYENPEILYQNRQY